MDWEPVAVIEGGVVYYVRADHIGRPAFATDVTGAVVWSASYLPFGEVRVSTGALPPMRFPGQWFQSESGLHQNWMRDYDPTTGRYLQPDPLGLVDGPSVYGYADQNPLNYYDIFGEEKKKYTKPENPNQRKGAEDRQKTGERERNIGHKDGEEHSRRPKGGFRGKSGFGVRFPFPILIPNPDWFCPGDLTHPSYGISNRS